jgi:hypothetical protein
MGSPFLHVEVGVADTESPPERPAVPSRRHDFTFGPRLAAESAPAT